MTRQEDYRAETAWQVLIQFKDEDISDTVQWMSEKSIITKNSNTTSLQRLLPGRAYKLHEHYLSVFGGNLPRKLVSHAKGYLEEVELDISSEELEIPVFSSPGEMVVLTELLMKSGISSRVEIPDNITEDSYRETLNFNVKLFIKQTNLGMTVRPSEDNLGNDSKRTKRHHISENCVNEPIDLLNVISSELGISKNLVNQVLAEVSSSGNLGITLSDLGDCINSHIRDLDEVLLYNLILKMTLENVIKCVGFETVRYVIPEHHSHWLPLSAVGSEVRIEPRVWNHLDGSVNNVIFKAACSALMGILIQKPGISEQHLYERLSLILCRAELEILLQNLVGRKAVRREFVAKPKNYNGFLEGLFEESTRKINYERCYIPLPDWYNKL